MDEHLLFAFGVVKSHLVVTSSARRRARLHSAHLVVLVMLGVGSIAKVGRHLISVINAAHDYWLVGIPFKKIDNHLLTDSRPETCAPSSARPKLAHADPAGAIGVILPFAIPMKLHLDPAILIGENFLARGAYDNGRLRSGNGRFGRHPRRTERQGEWNTCKVVAVGEGLTAGPVIIQPTAVLHRSQDVG